jgi:hypothetical protein
VHEELEHLFRGVEKALGDHLAGTEAAIVHALGSYDQRLADPERRDASLEAADGSGPRILD